MEQKDWKVIASSYELIKEGLKRVDGKHFVMYDMVNGTIRIDIKEQNG